VTSLLPFCSALLLAGFAVRSYCTFHVDDPRVYTARMLLRCSAAPLVSMTNSVILGRLFHFVPCFALMHPGRMVVLVAAFTAGIELLSITGIAYLTDREAPDKSLRLGDFLTRSSLALQLIVIGIYFVLVGIYRICCIRGRTTYRMATFILRAVTVWIVGSPSRLLPSDPQMCLAQDGKTILNGPGWEDSRSVT
ncbi:hypothetical protein MYCTH_35583, partial [Thermothelomyces thermophilus ATCC 42464]